MSSPERFAPNRKGFMGTGDHPDNKGYPYSGKSPWKDVLMTSSEVDGFDDVGDLMGYGTLGEFLDIQVEASDYDDEAVAEITAALTSGRDHFDGGGAAGLYRMRRVDSLDEFETQTPAPR